MLVADRDTTLNANCSRFGGFNIKCKTFVDATDENCFKLIFRGFKAAGGLPFATPLLAKPGEGGVRAAGPGLCSGRARPGGEARRGRAAPPRGAGPGARCGAGARAAGREASHGQRQGGRAGPAAEQKVRGGAAGRLRDKLRGEAGPGWGRGTGRESVPPARPVARGACLGTPRRPSS